jgi:hypothetical protein
MAAELAQAAASWLRRSCRWLGTAPRLATRGGGRGEPILVSHGSEHPLSEADDGGGMEGRHDSMEGRLRWMRSSELYPLSSATLRGTFSAYAREREHCWAVLSCAAVRWRGRKVGGADEGVDGATHGLCGDGLVACSQCGWGGTKPDTAEEVRLHEWRQWGGTPLRRGRESGKQKKWRGARVSSAWGSRGAGDQGHCQSAGPLLQCQLRILFNIFQINSNRFDQKIPSML